jgi:tetratricopeptide (TPR) repeat protein
VKRIGAAALLASALVVAGPAVAAEKTAPPAGAGIAPDAGTGDEAIVVEPGAALTESQKAEAKQHFLDGRTHYAAGEFREAADHFVSAYELTHAPELLYNLARCYERLGEKERAAEQYGMYLRMSPDAEDRAEVEQKIAALVEGPAPAPASAEAAEDKAAADAGVKIRLGVASGFDVPITGEWSRKSVPLDVVLLFGLNDWLYAGFGLGFVGFVGDPPVGAPGYPTGEFTLHGDLSAIKTIKGRWAFAARFSVAPTWVFRDHYDSVFWLAGRVGVGIHVDVWKSFGVLVEATGAIGPVFNRQADRFDTEWPKVSLSADAGGRFGITYVF